MSLGPLLSGLTTIVFVGEIFVVIALLNVRRRIYGRNGSRLITILVRTMILLTGAQALSTFGDFHMAFAGDSEPWEFAAEISSLVLTISALVWAWWDIEMT